MTQLTLSDHAKAVQVLDEHFRDAERAVQLRLQEHIESLDALRHAIVCRDNIKDTLDRLLDIIQEDRK